LQGKPASVFSPIPLLFPKKLVPLSPEFRRHSGGVGKDFTEKGVIEIIF
jgi:hypothetical protein